MVLDLDVMLIRSLGQKSLFDNCEDAIDRSKGLFTPNVFVTITVTLTGDTIDLFDLFATGKMGCLPMPVNVMVTVAESLGMNRP